MNNFSRHFLFFTFSLIFFFTAPAIGQQRNSQSANANIVQSRSTAKLSPLPSNSTTSGTVTIGGKAVTYKAIAGTMPILNEDETDTTAHMSFAAYLRDGITDFTQRPVTFFYNGGPGSATLWLHMGSFGPKWVVTDSTDHLGGAPYRMINNDYSLLDASDLVFIDAPGTGYGRVAKGHEKEYYNVDGDVDAFAKFISGFISQFDRWNSPKFIYGESYGTMRSAVLANVLQGRYSIDLNGVILLSQILNYANSVYHQVWTNPGNNKPYELALPTYAATAWYHHKLPQRPANLPAYLKEVEHFALNDYALALDKGATISEEEFNKIASQLNQYTGLSVEYLKRSNLRVDGGEFTHELLGQEGMSTGRLDTRYSGPLMDPLGQRSAYDPQSAAISSGYVALMNDYFKKELKYGENMVYRTRVQTGGVQWDTKNHRGSPGTLNAMTDLANAMKRNPKLQVMLNAGYYDLATPYFEGIYELRQLPMPFELQKNIHFAFYESGHMVYLHLPSLKAMHDNVKKFIENSVE